MLRILTIGRLTFVCIIVVTVVVTVVVMVDGLLLLLGSFVFEAVVYCSQVDTAEGATISDLEPLKETVTIEYMSAGVDLDHLIVVEEYLL